MLTRPSACCSLPGALPTARALHAHALEEDCADAFDLGSDGKDKAGF